MACNSSPCNLFVSKTGIVSDVTAYLDPTASAINCPPSSAQIPMGLGPLGNGTAQIKRKFRWTFDMQYCCGKTSGGTPVPAKTVSPVFVKMGNRPNIEIDETEINFLNAKTWIPGKGTWQPITFTYYDVAGDTGTPTSADLLSWLATIYSFNDPLCLKMASKPSDYEGVGRLVLYDGCGQPLESWILKHCWPTSINWGDLDMGSSDECTIEITLRYSEVCFTSFCPTGDLSPCSCTTCS